MQGKIKGSYVSIWEFLYAKDRDSLLYFPTLSIGNAVIHLDVGNRNGADQPKGLALRYPYIFMGAVNSIACRKRTLFRLGEVRFGMIRLFTKNSGNLWEYCHSYI